MPIEIERSPFNYSVVIEHATLVKAPGSTMDDSVVNEHYCSNKLASKPFKPTDRCKHDIPRNTAGVANLNIQIMSDGSDCHDDIDLDPDYVP